MASRTTLDQPQAERPAAAGNTISPSIRTTPARRRWRWRGDRIAPYGFVAPFVLLFIAFFIVPFMYAISQSFYRLQRSGLGFGSPEVVWAGLQNYQKALQDPDLIDGIKRVFLFGIIQIPLMMVLAIILALFMDSAVIRFRRFFRLAFFLPYAVPGVIAAIMWQFFYSPTASPIIKSFIALHLTPPDFTSAQTILFSIANIATWEFVGYNMIIFYSAMQAIPPEIYESGRLDGLSEFGIALRLKLPLIAPALVLGMLFSLIGTLQLFNEPLIIKNFTHAITSTFTPNIYDYNVAVVNQNYYYGGAIAVLLGLVTFAFSYGFLRLTRRQSGV